MHAVTCICYLPRTPLACNKLSEKTIRSARPLTFHRSSRSYPSLQFSILTNVYLSEKHQISNPYNLVLFDLHLLLKVLVTHFERGNAKIAHPMQLVVSANTYRSKFTSFFLLNHHFTIHIRKHTIPFHHITGQRAVFQALHWSGP